LDKDFTTRQLTSIRAASLPLAGVVAVREADAGNVARTAGLLAGGRSGDWDADVALALDDAPQGEEGLSLSSKEGDSGRGGAGEEES